MKSSSALVIGVMITMLAACSGEYATSLNPLPSWNDGPTKQAIVDFVKRVTDPNSPDFVPEEDRIATFDNDGTLWAEKPLYFQLLFAIDRAKAMLESDPSLRRKQTFKVIAENDREAMAHWGRMQIGDVMATTHANVTAEQFDEIVLDWMGNARHPRFDQPYNNVIYQPMVELLEYLRANGFKTFIVSGGGIAFIRTISEEAYGIPTDQVVGSTIETEFVTDGDRSSVVRLPELHFIDDKEGKPVAINRFIGKRPIAAFGNSDGDLQMLQYATGRERPGLAVIVHHDDEVREYAYDRESKVGRLDKAMDIAKMRGWLLVSMREDWRQVFAWAEDE